MEKKLVKMRTSELIPYENNPRKNDGAVEAVLESMKQCGYISPIIVDENNVVLAGHTRLKALMVSGVDNCEVMIVSGLTEDQKKKYRILDNKTSEFADWDMDALERELTGLDFDGFDFGFDALEKEIEDRNVTPVVTSHYNAPAMPENGADADGGTIYTREEYTPLGGAEAHESEVPKGPTAETAEYFSDDYVPDKYDPDIESYYGEDTKQLMSTVVTIVCQNAEEVEFIKSMLLEPDELRKLYKAKLLMERFGDGA